MKMYGFNSDDINRLKDWLFLDPNYIKQNYKTRSDLKIV